jgi:hypothetical protein
LGVIGLLLFVAGASLTWVLWSGDHGVMAGNRPARVDDAWLPALIALAGLVIGGYRSRTEYDVGRRLKIRHSSWWWRERERSEPLGEPQRVTLHHERRGSGKNSHVVFPVRLETDKGLFELSARGRELSARRDAEAVARIFSVPLADRRGGRVLVRLPEELDRSVLDADDGRESDAASPEGSRIERLQADGGTVFRVGSPFWWLVPLALIPCLIPVGIVIAIWLPRFLGDSGRSASLLGWIIVIGVPVLMAGVPMAVLLTGVRSAGLLSLRVHAGSNGLRIGRRVFPVHELEELHVAGETNFTRHLRIASDRATRRIGRGLSVDELNWLRASLISAMKHGGPALPY